MRIDVYLAAYGHTRSRKKAQDLIDAGAVFVDGSEVKKASEQINESIEHEIRIEQVFKYVSRGGMKLEAALNAFSLNVSGKRAVDVGASTGGFCDCLLQRGAVKVYAVDAGYGQLHESLAADPRVVNIEHFNARELSPEIIGELCDVATADVSFISQTYIIPAVASVLRDGGSFVSLIKPQFEAGKAGVGKNGIVVSAAYRYLAVKRVIECAHENGFDCAGLITSPITGGDGNIEYLAHFVKRSCAVPRITDKMILAITKNKKL
ncbi:MAG: TlyA family RNA methyltransferase [Ruminococcaceae bacterium]|nr:TlyA family RNA methyltransferase [Oscillospiraceae bacterium]